MSRPIDLSLLSRKQLENLVLVEHRMVADLMEIIRTRAKKDGAVQHLAEKLVAESVDKGAYVDAVVRTGQVELERLELIRESRRNDSAWGRWQEAVSQ